MIWDEITQKDLEDLDPKTVAILPVGSIEGHGPHMPLGTDYLDVLKIAIEAAKKTGSLVLPPITYGFAAESKHFPGTISLRAETFLNLLQDVCDEVARNGFKKILILNGHGGNRRILWAFTKVILNQEKDYFVYVSLSPFKSFQEIFEAMRETKIVGHAGELETSLILYMYPELVKLDRIVGEGEIGDVSIQDNPRVIPLSDTVSLTDWPGYCKEGYIGDPRKASVEKGEKMVTKWIDTVVEIINLIKKDEKSEKAMKEYRTRRRR
jgi:creatinine amidohydrolase